jgi:serine/threonine protein kinase
MDDRPKKSVSRHAGSVIKSETIMHESTVHMTTHSVLDTDTTTTATMSSSSTAAAATSVSATTATRASTTTTVGLQLPSPLPSYTHSSGIPSPLAHEHPGTSFFSSSVCCSLHCQSLLSSYVIRYPICTDVCTLNLSLSLSISISLPPPLSLSRLFRSTSGVGVPLHSTNTDVRLVDALRTRERVIVLLLQRVCASIDPTPTLFLQNCLQLYQNQTLSDLDFLTDLVTPQRSPMLWPNASGYGQMEAPHTADLTTLFSRTGLAGIDLGSVVGADRSPSDATSSAAPSPVPASVSSSTSAVSMIRSRAGDRTSPGSPDLSHLLRFSGSRYRSDFTEVGPIGKGGFGKVFKARHNIDGVYYAIKTVVFSNSGFSPVLERKVLREVTCLAKLDHPNICRYYNAWIEPVWPHENPRNNHRGRSHGHHHHHHRRPVGHITHASMQGKGKSSKLHRERTEDSSANFSYSQSPTDTFGSELNSEATPIIANSDFSYDSYNPSFDSAIESPSHNTHKKNHGLKSDGQRSPSSRTTASPGTFVSRLHAKGTVPRSPVLLHSLSPSSPAGPSASEVTQDDIERHMQFYMQSSIFGDGDNLLGTSLLGVTGVEGLGLDESNASSGQYSSRSPSNNVLSPNSGSDSFASPSRGSPGGIAGLSVRKGIDDLDRFAFPYPDAAQFGLSPSQLAELDRSDHSLDTDATNSTADEDESDYDHGDDDTDDHDGDDDDADDDDDDDDNDDGGVDDDEGKEQEHKTQDSASIRTDARKEDMSSDDVAYVHAQLNQHGAAVADDEADTDSSGDDSTDDRIVKPDDLVQRNKTPSIEKTTQSAAPTVPRSTSASERFSTQPSQPVDVPLRQHHSAGTGAAIPMRHAWGPNTSGLPRGHPMFPRKFSPLQIEIETSSSSEVSANFSPHCSPSLLAAGASIDAVHSMMLNPHRSATNRVAAGPSSRSHSLPATNDSAEPYHTTVRVDDLQFLNAAPFGKQSSVVKEASSSKKRVSKKRNKTPHRGRKSFKPHDMADPDWQMDTVNSAEEDDDEEERNVARLSVSEDSDDACGDDVKMRQIVNEAKRSPVSSPEHGRILPRGRQRSKDTVNPDTTVPYSVNALGEELRNLKYDVKLYIQTQLCEGDTVHRWLHHPQRVISSRVNMPIIHQILSGLQHVHARGVMHRDLKPSNLFVCFLENGHVSQVTDETINREWRAGSSDSEESDLLSLAACEDIIDAPQFLIKIGDFGLAKDYELESYSAQVPQTPAHAQVVNDDEDISSTHRSTSRHGLPRTESHSRSTPSSPDGRGRRRKGKVGIPQGVGTSTYSSPEQLSGQHYSTKSDIFSLGVIMYEMYHRFGTAMERAMCLTQLRKGRISETFRQQFPDEARLIRHMTMKSPHARPTASELLSDPFVLQFSAIVHHQSQGMLSPPSSPYASRESSAAHLSPLNVSAVHPDSSSSSSSSSNDASTSVQATGNTDMIPNAIQLSADAVRSLSSCVPQPSLQQRSESTSSLELMLYNRSEANAVSSSHQNPHDRHPRAMPNLDIGGPVAVLPHSSTKVPDTHTTGENVVDEYQDTVPESEEDQGTLDSQLSVTPRAGRRDFSALPRPSLSLATAASTTNSTSSLGIAEDDQEEEEEEEEETPMRPISGSSSSSTRSQRRSARSLDFSISETSIATIPLSEYADSESAASSSAPLPIVAELCAIKDELVLMETKFPHDKNSDEVQQIQHDINNSELEMMDRNALLEYISAQHRVIQQQRSLIGRMMQHHINDNDETHSQTDSQ